MTINEKGEELVTTIEGKNIHLIQVNRVIQVNSTISYGNMSYKYGPYEEVEINREKFLSDLLKVLEIKRSKQILEPIIMNPQMDKEIMVADKEMAGEGWKSLSSLECDGLLLLKPSHTHIIPIGLPVADCAPVSIYLPSTDTLMLIHVSRKNIDIIQDALEILYGIYLATIYDNRSRIKLVSTSNPNFEVFIIIGPAGEYKFNTTQIDIHREVIKGLEKFEEKVPISIIVYCSTYHTTSDSLFYSHHLIVETKETEARFLSLTLGLI